MVWLTGCIACAMALAMVLPRTSLAAVREVEDNVSFYTQLSFDPAVNNGRLPSEFNTFLGSKEDLIALLERGECVYNNGMYGDWVLGDYYIGDEYRFLYGYEPTNAEGVVRTLAWGSLGDTVSYEVRGNYAGATLTIHGSGAASGTTEWESGLSREIVRCVGCEQQPYSDSWGYTRWLIWYERGKVGSLVHRLVVDDAVEGLPEDIASRLPNLESYEGPKGLMDDPGSDPDPDPDPDPSPEEPLEGRCGDDVYYRIEDTPEGRTLRIFGTGAMTDYVPYHWRDTVALDESDEIVPWRAQRGDIDAIIIEDGVTSVGSYSFLDFPKLRTVEIADSVKAVGRDAFKNACALEELSLGSGLERIDEGAFDHCESLGELVCPRGLREIGDVAFAGSGLVELELNEGVETLGWHAFSGIGITQLHLPQSITRAGEGVFEGCESLSKIVFDCTKSEFYTQRRYALFTSQEFLQKNRYFYDATYVGEQDQNGHHATYVFERESLSSARVYEYSRYDGIAELSSYTYTGNPITLSLGVKVNGYELDWADMDITYANNTNAGTATIIITGKGHFTGVKKCTFRIDKAANPVRAKGRTVTVKATKTKKARQTFKMAKVLTVSKAQGKVTYQKMYGSGSLSVNKTTGAVTLKKGTKKGTYSMVVRVKAAGNRNYKAGTKLATIKVKVR